MKGPLLKQYPSRISDLVAQINKKIYLVPPNGMFDIFKVGSLTYTCRYILRLFQLPWHLHFKINPNIFGISLISETEHMTSFICDDEVMTDLDELIFFFSSARHW